MKVIRDTNRQLPVAAKVLFFLCTVLHKKEPLIFDYNSRISWSIFIIPAPVEREMNTPQCHIIYLLNCFMTSYCDTSQITTV